MMPDAKMMHPGDLLRNRNMRNHLNVVGSPYLLHNHAAYLADDLPSAIDLC